MYIFITGCLRNFCAVRTHKMHSSVTLSRCGRPFSFILVRFRHYSDILFFASSCLRFHNHVTSPIHAQPLYESKPTYSNLPLRHLFSTQQPSTRGFTFTTHLSYSSSGFRFYTFTFPIVFNAKIYNA